MGSYWSSDDVRLAELEARIRMLEAASPRVPTAAPTYKKPIIRPSWHAPLMKELQKRRESIKQ